MLSKYCSEIANKYEIKDSGVKKFVPDLGNKVKYVVHYKNLHYYFVIRDKINKSSKNFKI